MTRKRLFIIIAVVVVIAAVIIIAAVLLVTRDTDLRVKRLMDGAVPQLRDFENSRLRLDENGTFEIEIIMYEDTVLFAGIGNWTRDESKYHFYYLDAHSTRSSGAAGSVTAPDYNYIYKTYDYSIDHNTGWIVFFDHLGDPYHFG